MKLEEANKMTLQEMIDYAVDKIVDQGCQCSAEGRCSYGNEKGQHCAVGWLLDHENGSLMKSSSLVSHLSQSVLPRKVHENKDLFSWIQKFHDAIRKEERIDILNCIKSTYKFRPDINFENPNWEKWIELGESL